MAPSSGHRRFSTDPECLNRVNSKALQVERGSAVTTALSLSPAHRAIVALVYNVLKAFMEMNSTLFDELTATYKSDRQR